MVKLIFFGTPAFVLPVLDALHHAGFGIAAVVCAPDKPVGRAQKVTPPPTKIWAHKHNIPVLQPKKLDAAFLQGLQKINPTFGVIAAFGKIIPEAALDLFPKGVLNVHPSLLPRWRGPSPVQAATAAGDNEAGVTIMLTDKEMDHGPILAQKKIALSGQETAGVLTEQLFSLGAELLAQMLPQWLSGELTSRPQNHAQATYTKLLSRENGRLDFSKPAGELGLMIRAYHPWPGTFFEIPDFGRIKVLAAHPVNETQAPPVGTLFVYQGRPAAVCASGVLQFDQLQKEGDVPLPANEFLKKYRALFINPTAQDRQ